MTGRASLVRSSALGASIFALSATACGGGDEAGDATDGGGRGAKAPELVKHVDPKGFELSKPRDWAVETTDDLLITARSPDRAHLIAAAPFLAPQDTTATACLRRAPRTFSRLFGDGRPTEPRPLSGGSQAVATLRFAQDGTALRAGLLCSMDGRAGMLYAVAAPEAEYASMRGDLVRILSTLRFTKPTERKRADLPVTFREFRDPSEGAFTVDVPVGWTVEGGMQRRGPTEVWPRVALRAPGGSAEVALGEPEPRTYAVPNQGTAIAGLGEGADYPYGGAVMQVRSYLPGEGYARASAASRCAGLERTGGAERPGIADHIARLYSQTGVNVRIDHGDVRFRCSEGPRQGYLLVGTLLAELGPVGTWVVTDYLGYRSSAASEPLARVVMKRLIGSYRLDPDWVARQDETTRQTSGIVADANAKIADSIAGAYENRSASLDRVYRNWSNATLGQTDVRDPTTGTDYKVEAGHNYYWRQIGGDAVTGTDSATAPDIDFAPLERLGN